ncbi:probable receptor-like protein kinase At1g49730 [Cucurbita pepo subsp. pepo]|uniref:probable receptor-like protein kinase At1g49730 n=1 Tax=Cucurbita pepo subsp. pepo TaxID=3664 RepID=UPI000C9D86FA|nr:probable receptor-like protein kinase At1g49730 [Cucurbita pepo subsp. pepo]
MDRSILRFRHRLLAWLHRSRSVPVLNVKRFRYKEIKRATSGFNRVVYSNSRSSAYNAKFQDGRVALVKELRSLSDNGFITEVQLLGRLHHRHLLTLRGFSTGHKRLLVFDEIGHGSLRDHLNDPLRTPLSWRLRLQIAAGVAAALEYLLLFTNPPMCHVSISSSTIILDENFTAKISDIGFHCTPANISDCPDASNSDDFKDQKCGNLIYQLGALILELVTGQSSDGTSADLINWIEGTNFAMSMNKMIDPDLGNSFDYKDARNLLSVAKLCIKSREKPRFSIPQIFRYLQSKVYAPNC